MKRFTALLLVLIIAMLSLSGCGENADAPSGMQLVRGGDALGYYLYAPEGWIVANHGNIASTYVSTIDSTSVTLVEAEMPSGSIEEYFAEAEKEFTFSELEITKRGAAIKLGNADEASQFIYNYKYDKYEFRTMQIFAKFDGRFYIFTFTAQLTERNEGQSYYDFHLNNSLPSITENIKFVKKSGSQEAPEYPEVNGLLLVSDKKLCGFDLYIPRDYSVDYSHGIVSVTRADGANINVSKSTAGGVSIKDYWNARKTELGAIVGEITEINVNNTEGVKFGNLTTAASYEYTYEYGGVKYHVYQMFGVNSFDGYAFTFTAPETVYGERIDEALDIAARIEF